MDEYSEAKNYIEKLWQNENISRKEVFDVEKFVNEIDIKNGEIKEPCVDLWISILDDCISCLETMHYIIVDDMFPPKIPTDFQRAIMSVMNRIISDSYAIRRLVLSGLDIQASLIIRSFSEYVKMFIVLFDSPQLAKEFVAVETPEESKIFWEKHLRRKDLNKKVKIAYNKLEMGTSFADLVFFLEENIISRLDGMVHPSYMCGIITAFSFSNNYPDREICMEHGYKSENAAYTIFHYFQLLFPVLVFSMNYPFEKYNDSIN